MRVQITLTNGVQIEAEVENLTTRRDPVTGKLTEMGWDTPGDWTSKLHTLDLSQVAAIVCTRDPEVGNG